MDINKLYKLFLKYPFICTDSRKAVKNSLFFALKGKNFNGNQFALKALESGCSYAIVDEKKYSLNNRYLLVNDVLSTLQELAKYHRKKINIQIIAITGTNGKTTTKELINAVLQKKYKVYSTKGNLNNHIGVPLTLLSMTDETEIGIVEIGANHQGEINKLCEIVQPNYGLITNIGKAHLEGFGSYEGIKKAKAELYKYLSANKGSVFINSDNNILKNLIVAQEQICYGTSKFNNCQGKFISADPFLELKWASANTFPVDETKVSWDDKNKCIQSQLVGKYNFENVLAAICVGNYFGVNDKKLKEAIEHYKPQNNRSQLLKTKNNTLLLDAYNANPTNMEAAIDNFSLINAKNKLLILGDMLELGKVSEAEHYKIIELLKKKGFKNGYLIGKSFSKVSEEFSRDIPDRISPGARGTDGIISFINVDVFINWLNIHKIKDSYILIKASRGVELEKIVDYL